jgi:hypothetical protein
VFGYSFSPKGHCVHTISQPNHYELLTPALRVEAIHEVDGHFLEFVLPLEYTAPSKKEILAPMEFNYSAVYKALAEENSIHSMGLIGGRDMKEEKCSI